MKDELAGLPLKEQMKIWRLGVIPLPPAYIALHEQAARADRDRFLTKRGLFFLLDERLVEQGWMDGMKVLQLVVVDDAAGTLRTFLWSDSGNGSWFEKTPSGGSTLIEISPLSPVVS